MIGWLDYRWSYGVDAVGQVSYCSLPTALNIEPVSSSLGTVWGTIILGLIGNLLTFLDILPVRTRQNHGKLFQLLYNVCQSFWISSLLISILNSDSHFPLYLKPGEYRTRYWISHRLLDIKLFYRVSISQTVRLSSFIQNLAFVIF
jgi:hypothetical protein